MSLTCTRCRGTGFLNVEQCPIKSSDVQKVLAWMKSNDGHDVVICDCCGDGEGWYGEPGAHYGQEDPPGKCGPYAGNGGLCKCH